MFAAAKGKIREALAGKLWGSLLTVIAVALAWHGLFYWLPEHPRGQYSPVPEWVPTAPADTDAWFGLSAIRDGYAQPEQAVVQLSTFDEPALLLRGYNVAGSVDVTFYPGSVSALLQLLTHDEKHRQLSDVVDVAGLEPLASTTVAVGDYGTEARIDLPPNEGGITLVRVEGANASQPDETVTKDIFVVRSPFGTLVKSAERDFVFWTQDYATLHSADEGNVTVYDLARGVRRTGNAAIGADGTAAVPRSDNADVAVVTSGDGVAIVPMNIRYMNSEWWSAIFGLPFKTERLMAFTDRPLYRPGDTVYFKGVLRSDDDGRYAIPTGTVDVELWGTYGSEEPLQRQTLPVTATGAVDGSFVLPKESSTGYHRVQMRLTGGTWLAQSSFQVEHFRKPDYSIEVNAGRGELIAGEDPLVSVSGSYFSGEPLAGEKVEYKVYESNYYQYEYYSSAQWAKPSDDYRYGWWSNANPIDSGTVTLDNLGQALIKVKTTLTSSTPYDRVLIIEANYDGGFGNPSFSRKNVLVHRADFSLYVDDRKAFAWGGEAGANYALPLIAEDRRGNAVPDQRFGATVTWHRWQRYFDEGSNEAQYREVFEKVLDAAVTTGRDGTAVLHFPMTRSGSYDIQLTGKDARGNLIVLNTSAWAWAKGEGWYDTGTSDALQLQLDRKEYRPGDTAELYVTSDAPDRDVFVSVERGSMHRYHVLRVPEAIATQRIALTEDDMPNMWVRASTFGRQGYSSQMLNLPVSAEGKRLNVEVTPDRQKYGPGDTVTLTVRTTGAGGIPVSAETSVWAVDKALFELVGEQIQDPFEAFWSQRWNGTQEANSLMGITPVAAEKGGCFAAGTLVTMADGSVRPIQDVKVGERVRTRDQHAGAGPEHAEGTVTAVIRHEVGGYLILNGDLRVTPEHLLFVNGEWREAGSAQPGDFLTDERGGSVAVRTVEWQAGAFDVYNLTVDGSHTYYAGGVWAHNDKGGGVGPRSTFKDTAYWNPTVRTDASGYATVRFTVPDNLTTWVVSAVGATADHRFGRDRFEVQVSKDVILRPVLPNVLRQGDELVLAALLQNYTAADRAFATSLSVQGADVTPTREGDRAIPAGKSQMEYWRVNPAEPREDAMLTYVLQAKDDASQRDEVRMPLPIKALGWREERVRAATGDAGFDVRVQQRSDAAKTKVTLALAPSVLGTLPSAVNYLVGYAWGCVEQTVSRFVPTVIAARSPELFAKALEGKDANDMVSEGVQRLARLQNADGSWGWWYGGYDAFVTSYVVEHLLLAEQQGHALGETLTRARGHLENYASLENAVTPEDRVPAYYALALLGSSKARAISVQGLELDNDYLAMAVMTNVRLGVTDPEQNGAAQLAARASAHGSMAYWEAASDARFGSRSASTALAVRALLAADADRALVDAGVRYLAANRNDGYWENTFGTAQTMRALADYAAAANETGTNFTYQVTLDGETVATGAARGFRDALPAVTVAPERLRPEGSRLEVKMSGTGQLYSTLTVDEFRRDTENAAASNGLTIVRSYENASRPGKPFAVGDTVRVVLRVDGLPENGRYGVIEDELPSGLVPINETFRNEQFEGQNQWWYAKEVTENGVVMSLQWIWWNKHEYTYNARVVAEGSFLAPPAKVELMYEPSVNGRTPFQRFVTGQFE